MKGVVAAKAELRYSRVLDLSTGKGNIKQDRSKMGRGKRGNEYFSWWRKISRVHIHAYFPRMLWNTVLGGIMILFPGVRHGMHASDTLFLSFSLCNTVRSSSLNNSAAEYGWQRLLSAMAFIIKDVPFLPSMLYLAIRRSKWKELYFPLLWKCKRT